MDSVTPLLTVKQRIPPVRAGAVRREALEDRLRAADTGVTTVVAPAGWGKTSLLSAWALNPGENVRLAWLSLDDSDDESQRFWTYVLTALTSSSDDLSAAPLDALVGSGSAPTDLALPILLNELAASTTRHVLVLDDFHVLTDPRIHESVEFLVAYLPPALRLVIAGRFDPPLPIARMRAKGTLTELRVADLSLSVDEANSLVSTVSGSPLTDLEAAGVWERTEGWAAGLQLAALARRNRRGPGPDWLGGADRHLLDYFTTEVLPAITDEQRDLLVRAAPLERLSGPLCDAALQVTGSARIMAELDRADLFLVALDDEHEWYRCHHLLRDVLARDQAGDRIEVLRRAATWFADQDQLEESARHLLLAGDSAAAAALLARSQSWFWERGAGAAYLRLGERLSPSDVSPQLAVEMAYAAAVNGVRDRVTGWLDLAEAGIRTDTKIPGWDNAHAAVLTLRGLIGTPEADTARAVALCRRAVELETPTGRGYRIAIGSLGGALALDAQFAAAAELLVDLWPQRDQIAWTTGVRVQIGGTLGWCLVELGRDAQATAVLAETGAEADEAERLWGTETAGPFMAILRMAQGRQHLRRGDAQAARAILTGAVPVAESTTRPTIVVLCLVHLAAAELGCGDRPAARSALARAREIVDDDPVTPFAARELHEGETRVGRIAARSARRSGVLSEELTDRELSILRMLPGTATQREIGRALYLSVNTVKAYNKSLYRKLGVTSRQEAAAAAKDLGLV